MSDRGLKLLSQLFQSAGEGMMVFNSEGKVQAMNPRAEELFGYQESELLGKTMEQLVPEKLRGGHIAHREKYIAKPSRRSMGAGMDLSGQRKDGSTFPIEISLNYVEQNQEILVVAFITDISLRKEQERLLERQREELKKQTLELESKVKDRTRELEHLNLGLQSQIQERRLAERALKKSLEDVRKAEQEVKKSLEKERELSELKSRFVSMASHEFRTPLTTIASSANLIAKYPNTDQQADREKHITRIGKSVTNLTGILNDFLSLEKLESGAVHVNVSEVTLHEVLEEAIRDMEVTLKKGQEIICKKAEDVSFRTDPHLLKNLIYNLISNASKYSDEGKSIWVICIPKKDQLEIEIRDEGIGIPMDEQKNLFERFFRAANVTNIQGTGLGLHIVLKYVDLLGGKITFESKVGKGSSFIINLPI